MKYKGLLFFFICLFTGCTVLEDYENYLDRNQYCRAQLKEMKFKDSFEKAKTDIIDFDAIYYFKRESKSTDSEFNFIFRFFENGQYAFFFNQQKPIIGLSFEDFDYNNLEKANYVGYYNIKNDNVILEYPNLVFSQGGVRQFEKYRVLANGDLKRVVSIFLTGSNDVFKKIPIPEEKRVKVVPDW